MAITPVNKTRIIGYIRQCPSNKLTFPDMMRAINDKAKITYPEFLNFFLELAITELKKDKTSLSFVNKIILTLTSFIKWNVKKDFEISEEKLKKVMGIRELYDAYIEKSQDSHPDIEDNIRAMEEKVKELFPNYGEVVEDFEQQDSDYVAVIKELEQALLAAKEELNRKIEENNELSRALHSKDNVIAKKKNKLSKTSLDLQERKEQIKKLNATLKEKVERIEELERKIKELEALIGELTEQNQEIERDRRAIRLALYSVNKELRKIRHGIEQKEKAEQRLRQEQERLIVVETGNLENQLRDKEIQELLVQRMVLGISSSDELLNYMHEIGYTLSVEALNKYLKQIRDKGLVEQIERSNAEFVIPPSGEITSGVYNINLGEGVTSYDVLVVSDFHLGSFDKEIVYDMEMMNEYCVQNNISLILNAGDFFSCKHYRRSNQAVAVNACQKLIERVIEKFPTVPGIIHAILGGNHDKDVLAYGINPINELTSNRSDFIDLGFGHAMISFNGGDNDLINELGIHHPNKRYADFIKDGKYSSEEVYASLGNYYRNNATVLRDNVYVDLIGHIHRSSLDTDTGICIVPSYRHDRVCNGAWHLKIFFDGKGNIAQIVFIPLLKVKKLIPSTEICYQKKLVR